MGAPEKPMRAVQAVQNNTTIINETGGGTGGSHDIVLVTGVLGAGVTESGSVAMEGTGFEFRRIQVDKPARVRLYSTGAARDADADRPYTIPPTPGTANGVILDLFLRTSGQFDWMMSPSAGGFNMDVPQQSVLYYTITNLSSTSQAITTTISYTSTES